MTSLLPCFRIHCCFLIYLLSVYEGNVILTIEKRDAYKYCIPTIIKILSRLHPRAHILPFICKKL